MAKMHTKGQDKFVKGTITIPIRAYLTNVDSEEISDEEALKALKNVQDNLAGSNDGSELIANAKVEINNE